MILTEWQDGTIHLDSGVVGADIYLESLKANPSNPIDNYA